MTFTNEEAKIWEKQNIKKVEEEIYKASYDIDEEDDLTFLDGEKE